MPFAGQIHYTGRICWSDVRWSLAEPVSRRDRAFFDPEELFLNA